MWCVLSCARFTLAVLLCWTVCPALSLCARQFLPLPCLPTRLRYQVTKWPAMAKWSREYLGAAFEDGQVLVGDAPLPFASYCAYADTNTDELPLYL